MKASSTWGLPVAGMIVELLPDSTSIVLT